MWEVLYTAVVFFETDTHTLVHSCLSHLTFLHELRQQTTPLAAKDVGSSEAAVSTAHTQVGDASFHQVECSRLPALSGGEGLTASATDHSAALKSEDKQVPFIARLRSEKHTSTAETKIWKH